MNKKTGKYAGKRNYKSIALLSSLILLASLAVGATVAFLVDSTKAVENTFTPSTVDITVIEGKFDGKVKENVTIKNELAEGKGVKAYIRARVIVNWVDEDGNILPGMPDGCEQTIDQNNIDWTLKGNYWYYNKIVEPGKETTNLINSATYKVPEGVTDRLRIDILAEGIQAIPEQAVIDAWGFVPGK